MPNWSFRGLPRHCRLPLKFQARSASWALKDGERTATIEMLPSLQCYNITQIIHVWFIYLQLPHKWPSFVGKHTIHGWSGSYDITMILKPKSQRMFFESTKEGYTEPLYCTILPMAGRCWVGKQNCAGRVRGRIFGGLLYVEWGYDGKYGGEFGTVSRRNRLTD